MEKIKIYMRGWTNSYEIADMKNNIESLNGWLCRRIRMCIWKQWKLPRTRKRKLVGLGVDSHYAATIASDRKGYWFNARTKVVNWALNKERLIRWGTMTYPRPTSQCTSTIETAVYRTVRAVV